MIKTRMYSSRIRTVRCSSHLLGGGCLPSRESAQGGCLPGTSTQGGLPGGVSAQEVSAHGCISPGRCLADVPHPTPHPPPWTEFLTHACENITFPQLRLRTVNINWSLIVIQQLKCKSRLHCQVFTIYIYLYIPSLLFSIVSRKSLFERIKSLQCYE